jgi:hypothetical protein
MRIVLAAAASLVLGLSGCAASTPSTSDGAAPTTTSTSASASPSSDHTAHATPSAPAPTVPLRAQERFLTVGVADDLPDGTYTPAAPAGGTDDYRCFLVDPALAASGFVTGVQFLPGNAAIVHHSILFRVEPQQIAAAEAKDAADPAPGWQCFGGPGLPSTSKNPLDGLDAAPWLAGWAPGGKESVFATGTGVPLAAGSRIVVQMHYNLRAVGSGAAGDNTHVRLRVSTDPGLVSLRTMLLPGPVELPCPSGATDALCNRTNAVNDVVSRFGPEASRTVAGLQLLCGGSFENPKAAATQICKRFIRETVTVRAAAGHMHLLGKSIHIEANAGTARARTILDIPVWDFDNQSAQPLSKPLTLKKGDTVTVTCTHDVTLRDKLPALAGMPPRYVVWGEGTTDEMCLGILIVSD